MMNPIKALRELREVTVPYGPFPDDEILNAAADALESALEGLFQVYVELGEDTDGARNAKELFSWFGFDPATHIPELVAAFRKQSEEDYEADLAKAWDEGHRKGIRWNREGTPGNPYKKEQT